VCCAAHPICARARWRILYPLASRGLIYVKLPDMVDRHALPRRGHPSRELAYALITSLTPEDRRAAQRDLLDNYRHALTAAGGPDLDRDDLWLRFRQGALYGYVAPLITAGMGGMQVEDIAMEGLRRGVAALDDLETIAALKHSVP
jgi:hypothetical protein